MRFRFLPSLSQVLDTERGSNRDETGWGATPDIQGALLMALAAMKKNVPEAIASISSRRVRAVRLAQEL